YIIGLIILIILKKVTNKFNFIEYLKKELKSRPSEKISNIIMNTKTSMVLDNQKKNRLVFNIIAILLPLVIFINPRIMYEDIEGGYAVRFYAFGLLNFQSAEIPAEHNGKPVISLRGNTFSNMPFLKEVKLPDTIKEIRGQAFKNDLSLTKVNIPTNLEYLGGGAFYNCLYIKEVELPDTLTFLGGESFYNAISLTKVKLSDNLTEIRGNTFENCHSLESITIPDKVERIGGHAFYGNSSLQEVNITENSKLREIGSSAFRLCSSLKSITLPSTTYVNGRAFKESPTEIKKFGEIDYNNLVDKTKYARNFYIHLYYIGNTQTVNPYIKDAIIYSTNITFIDAKLVDGSYQYTLKYTDETGETTFIIDKDNLYKEINENLVFSIGSKYSLESFNSGFSLNVYYN
ncbi:MAG: leucine-rich repeat domain-containing protein, partial [Bacilli bacterium]|nr:leucine-rich repeat domain-containing protein [Bacilli bacterium]